MYDKGIISQCLQMYEMSTGLHPRLFMKSGVDTVTVRNNMIYPFDPFHSHL